MSLKLSFICCQKCDLKQACNIQSVIFQWIFYAFWPLWVIYFHGTPMRMAQIGTKTCSETYGTSFEMNSSFSLFSEEVSHWKSNSQSIDTQLRLTIPPIPIKYSKISRENESLQILLCICIDLPLTHTPTVNKHFYWEYLFIIDKRPIEVFLSVCSYLKNLFPMMIVI